MNEIKTPAGHKADGRIEELEDDRKRAEDESVPFSNEDLKRKKDILELALREEKAHTQRKMAWIALWGIIVSGIVLFTPIVPDARVEVLGDLLGLFFLALAGIVGAFMGFSTWMGRR